MTHRIVFLALVALATIVGLERRAHAYAACMAGEGWALPDGAVVPPRAKLVYFIDARIGLLADPPKVIAKIAGRRVPAKVSVLAAPPYDLVLVEIGSARAGKLELTWDARGGPSWRVPRHRASYRVRTGAARRDASGTWSRFHVAYQHSTVHELEDGLAVAVDVPATRFVASWRRDATLPWTTMQLTAVTRDGKQVARLGALGCNANFAVTVLERGIELRLVAVLPDGAELPVKGLPARIVLPRLPPGAPMSTP